MQFCQITRLKKVIWDICSSQKICHNGFAQIKIDIKNDTFISVLGDCVIGPVMCVIQRTLYCFHVSISKWIFLDFLTLCVTLTSRN